MFPKEALSIRSFRNLWLGQAISQLGDSFYYVVFMFMVGKITGSNAMVGFTGAAEMIPFLVFGAYAGVLADRIDRRRIMMLSDIISGAVLVLFGIVVFFNTSPPGWTMIAIAGLLSCVRAFFLPAKSAAIPALVPEDMLLRANALSSMTQSVMPMIGLALSASVLGLLYTLAREWFFVTAILFNVLSFFGSAAYIRLLPVIRPDRKEEGKHAWREFRAGVGYIRRQPVLRAYAFLSVFMNLMISPFFVAYVATNKELFGGTPQILCFIEFTFFVGLVFASSIVAKMGFRKVGLGYAFSLGTVGLAVAGMAFSKTVLLFSVLNIICGLAIPFCDIPLTTYFQVTVPDHFRGRVGSVLTMVRLGVMPIGLSLGGLLVNSAGLTNMYLIMGLGMTAVALLALANKAFRSAELPENANSDVEEVAESAPVLQVV